MLVEVVKVAAESGDWADRACSMDVQYFEEVVGEGLEGEVKYDLGGEEAVLGLAGWEPHEGTYLIINRLVILLDGLK